MEASFSENRAVTDPAAAETLWRALARANQLLEDEINRRLVAAGEQPTLWLEVTDTLARLPDRRLRQRELSGLVQISPSGLSRLLDRIEAAGLIERQPSAGDRRGADLILTEAGLESVRASKPIVQGVLTDHLTGALGPDTELVRAALRKVVSSLQRADRPTQG